MLRALASFLLVCSVGAIRSGAEDAGLEVDTGADFVVSAANASVQVGAPRWVIAGTADGCPASQGWKLDADLPMLTQLAANYGVYYVLIMPLDLGCNIGLKVLVQQMNWNGAIGSSTVNEEEWGHHGKVGTNNIIVPQHIAASGFSLLIDERNGRYAFAKAGNELGIAGLLWPKANELSKWHINPFVQTGAEKCGGQDAQGPFQAWPMAVMRFEPTDGGINLDTIKAGHSEKFTMKIYYDAMIDDKLVSFAFDGVKASVVGAEGSAGKQKKSFRLSFKEQGATQLVGQRAEQRFFIGVQTVSLRANANDCTLMRELLVTDLYFATCVPAYRQIPVKVFVRDQYYSTFLMTEWFDGHFVERAFGRTAVSTDTLIDMGYGETFAALPNDAYYGQGYHHKPRSGGCPADSEAAGTFQEPLCKVSYSNAAFISVDGQQPDASVERGYLGKLMTGINAVTQSDASSMLAVLDVDRVMRAMAVDLIVGQWDDFYRNYNNFFLFREFDQDHPYYYLIPFDCDWAFHRKAFYNPGADIPGVNADWDEYCCMQVGGFKGERSRLITAILGNLQLRGELLEHLAGIISTFFVPPGYGKSVTDARLEYIWNALKDDIRGDDFYGACKGMMKTGDDFADLTEFLKTRPCFLLKKLQTKHTDIDVSTEMANAGCM